MRTFRISTLLIILLLFLIAQSCKESFLEITPNGALDESVLGTYDGVDGLLIGAYSMLDGISDQGTGGWEGATSGWVYGSIRGLEANKGTDAGDQSDINPIALFQESPTNIWLNLKWRSVFEAISRTNATIRTAKRAVELGTITEEESTWFINQARTLRGFYHFEGWRLWGDLNTGSGIPYIDEETNILEVTNTEDVRDRIIADLGAGIDLPNDMVQVGRFNKTIAQFLKAKALMQMKREYAQALDLLTTVVTNGTNPANQKAGFEKLYGDIFDAEFRNGVESIYTVQYSVNDGSGAWNGGWGEVLNFPYKGGSSPGGCCGFFSPTQDFVNSFRTDANGLPFLDNYNDIKVSNDQGLTPGDTFDEFTGNLDPRLDWSVGRRGIPYWDWGVHTGSDWIRDQSYAGPYSPKKQVYKKSQEGTLTEIGNWTSGWTANGYRLIRYADAVLLKAECEAMTNTDDLGLGEVNAVRLRAANPDGFVKNEDGTHAANYSIGLYTSFTNTVEAMKAIKFERKLELGMEGHRYYDLQRWGDVQSELNRILEYEKTMEWGPSHYSNASVGPEDVNYPVPQRQIDLSNGNIVQNR